MPIAGSSGKALCYARKTCPPKSDDVTMTLGETQKEEIRKPDKKIQRVEQQPGAGAWKGSGDTEKPPYLSAALWVLDCFAPHAVLKSHVKRSPTTNSCQKSRPPSCHDASLLRLSKCIGDDTCPTAGERLRK